MLGGCAAFQCLLTDTAEAIDWSDCAGNAGAVSAIACRKRNMAMADYDAWNARLIRAILTDNRDALRAILDQMRRRNVGEAQYTPGLRELCKQARQILTARCTDVPA